MKKRLPVKSCKTILPQQQTWAERWKSLSASLPDEPQISEREVLDEISQVRQERAVRQ